MLNVLLPGGERRTVPAGRSLSAVASDLRAALPSEPVAARAGGRLVDLFETLPDGAEVSFVLPSEPDGLEILRHSSSHIMAEAVIRLFPGARTGVGPAIENGFYYDFDLPRALTPEDLPKIEEEMRRIVEARRPFVREEVLKAEAVRRMEAKGQTFKIELISGIPDPSVSLYGQGGFTDLCRGPHLPHTGRLAAFKLQRVSGAYWKGDARGKPLQRIYGTSFYSKDELDRHLALLVEAEKRDHRRVGVELDLFSFKEESPGCAFWHPKGTFVYNRMVDYLRGVLDEAGYQEVRTPTILDDTLWARSGHLDNYRENMFFTAAGGSEILLSDRRAVETDARGYCLRLDPEAAKRFLGEPRTYAVKPMNCPGAILLYQSKVRSYRELPLRLAEFGHCHRSELSGVLHGLFRVRAFTQDDAHIFCAPEQVEAEISAFLVLLRKVYARFGFHEVRIELSTKPDKSIGEDALWARAEAALRSALSASGMPFGIQPGGGAFYGPKIDFHVKDALGRSWQCGTVQLDFALPERFDLEYVPAEGLRPRPVMIHRAILGSLERFIGILVEHTGGDLPLWLAPLQARVASLTEKEEARTREVFAALRAAGVRVDLDVRGEKMGAKVRDATLAKIPFFLVVGAREAKDGTVSVRDRKTGKSEPSALGAFVERLRSLEGSAPGAENAAGGSLPPPSKGG
ncbi:MAG: threonine--tRNA ligase [Planctomycetota bacterium]